MVVVWQAFLAALGGVTLRWQHTFIVAASVWLGYAADRWFEGWRVSPGDMRTPRHRFYQRFRWPMAALWTAVLVADLTIAFTELTGRELLFGSLLLIPTLLYLLSHQLVHRHHKLRAPKEVCIAVLLAGAASVFVMAHEVAFRPLAAVIALFAALCFANVALIAIWEQEIDESHGQVSLARQFQLATAFSRTFPFVLIAMGAFGTSFGIPAVAAHCVAASGILLVLIDRYEPRLGWQLARVLADAALLTPLIPLLLTPTR